MSCLTLVLMTHESLGQPVNFMGLNLLVHRTEGQGSLCVAWAFPSYSRGCVLYGLLRGLVFLQMCGPALPGLAVVTTVIWCGRALQDLPSGRAQTQREKWNALLVVTAFASKDRGFLLKSTLVSLIAAGFVLNALLRLMQIWKSSEFQNLFACLDGQTPAFLTQYCLPSISSASEDSESF